MSSWYSVANIDEVTSPSLLVYPDRIEANIRNMVTLAGGAQRLFPHIKTHKLPEVVRLQQAQGIQHFKCATIAEAEMAAGCGVKGALLAYQPVGPNVNRLLELCARFPGTQFGALTDNEASLRTLAGAAQKKGAAIEVLLDLDLGMQRTGIPPGPDAAALYRLICGLPGVRPGGLHAYDGHIHDRDPEVRRQRTREALAPVKALADELRAQGLPVPRIIAGGTPTFPIHAREHDVDCSPGTCLLMDAGYESIMPDDGFVVAAVVLSRVISKPRTNRLCLDLGHKAIASENPHPRVHFLALPEAKAVGHSEEHLVLETPRAGEFQVGDALYGIPQHICPTVALHSTVTVVRRGRADGRWKVVARDRMLTV